MAVGHDPVLALGRARLRLDRSPSRSRHTPTRWPASSQPSTRRTRRRASRSGRKPGCPTGSPSSRWPPSGAQEKARVLIDRQASDDAGPGRGRRQIDTGPATRAPAPPAAGPPPRRTSRPAVATDMRPQLRPRRPRRLPGAAAGGSAQDACPAGSSGFPPAASRFRRRFREGRIPSADHGPQDRRLQMPRPSEPLDRHWPMPRLRPSSPRAFMPYRLPMPSPGTETERIRAIYDRRAVTAPSARRDAGLEWVCSRAQGETLEIGIGRGRTLPFYPRSVHLTGLELSEVALAVAPGERATSGWMRRCSPGDAAALPFADEQLRLGRLQLRPVHDPGRPSRGRRGRPGAAPGRPAAPHRARPQSESDRSRSRTSPGAADGAADGRSPAARTARLTSWPRSLEIEDAGTPLVRPGRAVGRPKTHAVRAGRGGLSASEAGRSAETGPPRPPTARAPAKSGSRPPGGASGTPGYVAEPIS